MLVFRTLDRTWDENELHRKKERKLENNKGAKSENGSEIGIIRRVMMSFCYPDEQERRALRLNYYMYRNPSKRNVSKTKNVINERNWAAGI